MAGTAAARGAGHAVIGALAAIIFGAAAINHHLFNGLICGAVFWFGANRLIAWLIGVTTPSDDDAAVGAAVGDVDPELVGVLAKLEAARVDMAAKIDQRMRLRLPAGLAGGVFLWARTQFSSDPAGPIALATFAAGGAMAGWLWASASLSARYRAMYKSEVLPRLASGFGALTYRPAETPDVELLRRQRLFPQFNRIEADDEICGTYHGVPLSIVELKLQQTQDKDTRTVFDGLLTRVTLPRQLRGTTAVIADGGMIGNLRDLFGGAACERVKLEDPDFERLYQVYGTDQIAARALLTPAFMERFMALGARTGFTRPVALAQDNQLTIAMPKQDGGDLFEPPDYRRPAGSRAAIAKLHDDIATVLGVAESVIELDQSVRGNVVAGDGARQA